jgi:hypothetical protein
VQKLCYFDRGENKTKAFGFMGHQQKVVQSFSFAI